MFYDIFVKRGGVLRCRDCFIFDVVGLLIEMKFRGFLSVSGPAGSGRRLHRGEHLLRTLIKSVARLTRPNHYKYWPAMLIKMGSARCCAKTGSSALSFSFNLTLLKKYSAINFRFVYVHSRTRSGRDPGWIFRRSSTPN